MPLAASVDGRTRVALEAPGLGPDKPQAKRLLNPAVTGMDRGAVGDPQDESERRRSRQKSPQGPERP